MTVEEFIKIIEASTQHTTLYHFTDEANFSSIDEHGLLSKAELKKRQLWPPAATGGNDLSHQLDNARGIDPYVSLCLTRNHGMQFVATKDGRLKKPRYLGIKPQVLLIAGTRMAFGIANANDVKIVPMVDAIDQLDREVLYTRTNWSDPAVNKRLSAAEKFEVLVPDSVPRDQILGYY